MSRTALEQKIISEISSAGRWSFAQLMSAALYDSEYGYYSTAAAEIGREGDFVTSVSIGSCFGSLLAEDVIKSWKRQGSPQQFVLIEQGAASGQLMALDSRERACIA